MCTLYWGIGVKLSSLGYLERFFGEWLLFLRLVLINQYMVIHLVPSQNFPKN